MLVLRSNRKRKNGGINARRENVDVVLKIPIFLKVFAHDRSFVSIPLPTASSFSLSPPMAGSSLPTNPLAFAPIFFLLVLSTFIFFTKRNAEVFSLSLFRDLSFQTPFTVSLVSPPPTAQPHISFSDLGADSSALKSLRNSSSRETVLEDKRSVSAVGAGGEADLPMEGLKKCDLYMGTWVKDERYPIYGVGSCPYVDEAYDCGNNGRADSEYTKWRWKPYGCDLPR